MKREIKFRAWNKTNKWMDDEFCIHADGSIYQDARKVHNTPYQEIETAYDDLIIMQFTGLLDRNGKEIYEGDIMQHVNPFSYLFIVNWDDEVGEFIFNSGCTGYLVNDTSFEVIGNIHENPELL